MKKFFTLFLLGAFAFPAGAEVAPAYYYDNYDNADVLYYVDDYGNILVDEWGNPLVVVEEEIVEEVPAAPVATTPAPKTTASSLTATPRAAAPSPRTSSRAAPSAPRVVNRTAANTGVVGGSRPISSRGTTPSRGMLSTSSASRVSVAPNTPTVSSAAATKTVSTATPPRRLDASNRTVTARAGLLQGDTINAPLYINSGTANNVNAERIGIRPTTPVGSSLYQSSTARAPAINNASASAAPATTDDIARVTETCRDQYLACMDSFCDVLDETQGRCVCSSNADKYKEIEDALKNATEELQNVAQKIQYIGLTKDEINAIFTETEAETAMVGQKDTSQIKADLDKIRKMVIEVDADTYNTNNFSFLFDIDFTFDNGFNLYDWLMGINGSVLRQRGSELYSNASSKCRQNVLDACKKQGVDTAVLVSNYDLTIDRDCIDYEKVLDDQNVQMKRTVLNANNVLQKARLVIAQNKNIYDLRGCVNALDSCMQDDFACGTDYEYCLDPTGKYIANGEVIIGSQPGHFDPSVTPTSGIYAIWNYGAGENAWATAGSIDTYIDDKIKSTSATDMVGFLQAKIGKNDRTRNTGMCMSVLNQCQDYTYTSADRSYNVGNDVVKQYLSRTLATVKALQDEILADFASNCISRVQSCLSVNNAEVGYDNTNKGRLTYAAYNACRALITSCASVNNDPTGQNIVGSAICYLGTALPNMPPVNGSVTCP